MSTSGTTTWALQRDAIITAALRKLAVLSSGSPPSATDLTNGAQALNAMIKGFQADGMPVWAMKSYTFTTIANQGQYLIGTGQALNTPMPLKVTQAWRNQSSNSSNIPMNIYTDYNFNLLPQLAGSAVPVNLYYQPFSTYGQINLWPLPQDTSYSIIVRYQRPFEDMNASTDDLDFPSFWTEAMIYGLANRLAPEYGLPIQDRQLLTQEATLHHQNALSFGTEEGSIYFQPDWAGRT
jgi:hypothetical protein